MKKVYVTPSIKKSSFQCEDIITTSALATEVNGITATSVGSVAANDITSLEKLNTAMFVQ